MAGALHARARRSRQAMLTAAVVAAALAATITTAAAAGSGRRVAEWRAPPRLADTGLYSDFASRTVAPGNTPFSPQYPLWSDGAAKARWIQLPKGASIDARDPDAWKFPVGTKLWKEFSWGRRVETRYLELTRQGWRFAAYHWLDDESDAVLAPASGAATTQQVAAGRMHRIPSVADCKTCHEGGRSAVLGFSALQLSRDRDPLAPHREPLQADMPTLDALVARGQLRNLPRALLDRPPRIDAPTPRARAALGYLHANCSVCHDDAAPLGSFGANLRQPLLATASAPSGEAVVVGQATRFQIPGAARSLWIDPGAPASSAIHARMGSRDPFVQMPPLGTQVVDQEALSLVRQWIEEDLRTSPRDTAIARPSR